MADRPLVKKHPLAEVFGFKSSDHSNEARRHRALKLCPHNNIAPECTKASKTSPIGVCSIFYGNDVTVVCPVRFREKFIFYKDAADFFFSKKTLWTPVKEIRLKQKDGSPAGNIDVVIIAHDQNGRILDFGAVEVQAVYVSGNIRRPFEKYILNPESELDWTNEKNYPRPDYLSSSRKRLIPQLAFKGRILRSWNKKQAVVIDTPFFKTLPALPQCGERDADLCWLVYKLQDVPRSKNYNLTLDIKLMTGFDPVMESIGTPEIGDLQDFMMSLESKLFSELKELKKNYGVSAFSELFESDVNSIYSRPPPENSI